MTAETSSALFIELGLCIFGLAALGRVAQRFGFSSVPLYLLAGLAFGKGGLAPIQISEEFIHIGAEIGVLLLLFMLGLEYTGEQLQANLRIGLPAGIFDFFLNFTPGLIAGFLLGWQPLAAVLLGGVTYISSSGIIAKVLGELGRLNNPEMPAIISVLVLEDLAMALYLPLVAVLSVGGTIKTIVISVAVAVFGVLLVLVGAIRYGQKISAALSSESDEIILLTTFGAILLIGGIAQRYNISSAIGAFLVGIAVSGRIAEQSHRLLAPLRDLFAAIFFFFFGLQIDPRSLIGVLPVAIALGIATAATKVLTGYWAARRIGVDQKGRWRAGLALIPRGEFSIIIAGLAAGSQMQLELVSGAYVLFLAIVGPLLVRVVE